MIDFHTHIFPDKIAGKTLEFLSGRCKTVPFTDGTAEGLRASGAESVHRHFRCTPGRYKTVSV